MGDISALVSAAILFGQLSGKNSLLCPDLQGISWDSVVFVLLDTWQGTETIGVYLRIPCSK